MLLEAGREILLEEGLDTGSSNLTFKRVFERVERTSGLRLTNASVIKRVWENQADFQADVLVAIAHDEARPETSTPMGALAALFEDLDLSTAEARAHAMREVCRVGGSASSEALAVSTSWPLWINTVAMATATNLSEERRRIRAALLEGYEVVTRFWEEIFEGLVAALGFRMRQPWTMRQYTVAVTSYSQGCSLRQRLIGDLGVVVRPTGPNGEDQEWTLFSAGMEALMEQFFEPDPEFEVTPPER